MKKAKLMLSALAVVAVVGSAFAFKAANFTNHFLYIGTLGTKSCTTPVNGRAISTGTAAVAASTASNTIDCPDVFTTTTSDL